MRRITAVSAVTFVITLALTASAGASANPSSPSSLVFARSAHPYGAAMSTWAQRIDQWIYSEPFDVNPGYDQTGAHCAIDQHGPAWFVPPIFVQPGTKHPFIQNATRPCTVPAHHALLLDIGSVVDDWPCPDPSFTPPPGESLYDFLVADAKPVMDTVNALSVSIDGKAIPGVLSYRFRSAHLFLIKGDLSLQPVLDGCITGSYQPTIVDGFFMMVKPLPPGFHTIVVHGTNTIGDDRTFNYKITVVG